MPGPAGGRKQTGADPARRPVGEGESAEARRRRRASPPRRPVRRPRARPTERPRPAGFLRPVRPASQDRSRTEARIAVRDRPPR